LDAADDRRHAVAPNDRRTSASPRIISPSVPSFDSWATAWVVVALIAAIVEVSIPHFGVIFVAIGAVAAAIAALLSFSVTVQILFFIAAVSVGFAVLRP